MRKLCMDFKSFLHQDKFVLVMAFLNRIHFKALRRLRHQLKCVYQSNMNSAKIKARTNIKFMVKCGWKSGEIIGAFQKFMGTEC